MKTAAPLCQLVRPSIMREAVENHWSDIQPDFCIDMTGISMSGFYTLAELQAKVDELRDAQRLLRLERRAGPRRGPVVLAVMTAASRECSLDEDWLAELEELNPAMAEVYRTANDRDAWLMGDLVERSRIRKPIASAVRAVTLAGERYSADSRAVNAWRSSVGLYEDDGIQEALARFDDARDEARAMARCVQGHAGGFDPERRNADILTRAGI